MYKLIRVTGTTYARPTLTLYQLAKKLQKEEWVKSAKVISGVHAGDANEDIPYSHLLVTTHSGKGFEVNAYDGDFSVQTIGRENKKNLDKFFENIGYTVRKRN